MNTDVRDFDYYTSVLNDNQYKTLENAKKPSRNSFPNG